MADPRIKRLIRTTLQKEFVHGPGDSVSVEDGYFDNVHVRIESQRFSRMKIRQIDDLVWSVLFGQLPKDAWETITLVEPVKPTGNGRQKTSRRSK